MDSKEYPWTIEMIVWRYVIGASAFAVLNGLWVFAPAVGGRFGWSLDWVLSELTWTFRGMIYLYGGFVTVVGLYDSHPWRNCYKEFLVAPIIGVCIILFNLAFGFCMDAFANCAYNRGHWDGIRRRPPCDYRQTDIPLSLEVGYRDGRKNGVHNGGSN